MEETWKRKCSLPCSKISVFKGIFSIFMEDGRKMQVQIIVGHRGPCAKRARLSVGKIEKRKFYFGFLENFRSYTNTIPSEIVE